MSRGIGKEGSGAPVSVERGVIKRVRVSNVLLEKRRNSWGAKKKGKGGFQGRGNNSGRTFRAVEEDLSGRSQPHDRGTGPPCRD